MSLTFAHFGTLESAPGYRLCSLGLVVLIATGLACSSPSDSPSGDVPASGDTQALGFQSQAVQAGSANTRDGNSSTPAYGGDTGVSADARERDLEISSYRTIDYLAFQQTIRGALASAGSDIANVASIPSGDVTARTAEELKSALAAAKSGSVVFLPGTSRIDLTGHPALRIPDGVTLASDRGIGGSSGALVYTNDSGNGVFLPGRGARIVGLSLMGPDPSPRTYQLERLRAEGGRELYYAVPTAVGVRVEASDVVIENCEVWAWSRSGIEVVGGATGVVVRHCFIHHNQRLGLGYGIYVDQAEVKAEANLFDWYRHCVAGSGRPGTSYEARFNFVLANASGHAFDMHGGKDREDGTDVAGTRIRIHQNIVEAAQFPAVVIRGTPEQPVEIVENQFRNPEPGRTIVLMGGSESARVHDNRFGVSSVRPK